MRSSIGAPISPNGPKITLATLCWMILRIASTSFGGFMAMISVMQNVVVERRKLLSDEDMLNGISLASVLPGPTAINVVAYIGYRLRGIAGAAICVCAAVLPAFLLMVALSIAYFNWGQAAAMSRAFTGIVPAVAAIVAVAAWRMCRTAVKVPLEGLLAASGAAAVLGIGGVAATLSAIVAAGAAGYLWLGRHAGASKDMACEIAYAMPDAITSRTYAAFRANAGLLVLIALPLAAATWQGQGAGTLATLFGVFTGLSMLMFGGGYVFIPLFQETVVHGYGWVTQQQFIDAIALGQVTPGPIMISAAFIGYKLAGVAGAAVATAGMFIPTAALAVLCARMLSGARASIRLDAVLRGVRAATSGMVCAAAISIGMSAEQDAWSATVFAAALAALTCFRVEAVWIVPAAGLIGYLVY